MLFIENIKINKIKLKFLISNYIEFQDKIFDNLKKFTSIEKLNNHITNNESNLKLVINSICLDYQSNKELINKGKNILLNNKQLYISIVVENNTEKKTLIKNINANYLDNNVDKILYYKEDTNVKLSILEWNETFEFNIDKLDTTLIFYLKSSTNILGFFTIKLSDFELQKKLDNIQNFLDYRDNYNNTSSEIGVLLNYSIYLNWSEYIYQKGLYNKTILKINEYNQKTLFINKICDIHECKPLGILLDSLIVKDIINKDYLDLNYIELDSNEIISILNKIRSNNINDKNILSNDLEDSIDIINTKYNDKLISLNNIGNIINYLTLL